MIWSRAARPASLLLVALLVVPFLFRDHLGADEVGELAAKL